MSERNLTLIILAIVATTLLVVAIVRVLARPRRR